MKKTLAMLLVAMLALSAAAFAATYENSGITFDYNEEYFTLSMDDHGDGEDLVILTDKNEGGVKIYVSDLKDGETFPTLEDFKDIEEAYNIKVEKMDTWGNFKDVFTYDINSDDFMESTFIAPIYGADGQIVASLTVDINGSIITDEDAAMENSDWISEVVDSLNVTRTPQGYGASELYTAEELEAAAALVKAQFASFEGCELHSLRYAGDACNSEENIQWMNSLDKGKGFVQVAEFLSDFHSPVDPGELTSWEADQEYTDYEWWLARVEGGAWQLLTWGY